MQRSVTRGRDLTRRNGALVALGVLDGFRTDEGELLPVLREEALREACYLSGLPYSEVRRLAVVFKGRKKPPKKPPYPAADLEATTAGPQA